MNPGEMKPASSQQIEFSIKQLKVRQATQSEDFDGADIFLNKLAVGHRVRNLPVSAYSEITIRKRDNSESEYEKIISGRCLAKLFIFEFSDAYVLCKTKDIRECLLNSEKHGYVHNKSEFNGFCTIKLAQIPHILIDNRRPAF